MAADTDLEIAAAQTDSDHQQVTRDVDVRSVRRKKCHLAGAAATDLAGAAQSRSEDLDVAATFALDVDGEARARVGDHARRAADPRPAGGGPET